MIIDSKQMRKMESESGFDTVSLMQKAGISLSEKIENLCQENDRILILAGKGNNGGDGSVIMSQCHLKNKYICYLEGEPTSKEALLAYQQVSPTQIVPLCDIKKEIELADVIIDAVYGFGYHGTLSAEIKKIFRKINEKKKTVISIDINSGAESDTGHYDADTIRSKVTLAIECYKPFHMMQKEHNLFEQVIIAPINIKHPKTTTWPQIDEQFFFRNFPKKPENAYKGTYGKTLICGGSYGTSGAVSLNIIGAKTVGASYILAALPDECYNIVASQHITPVYHPFSHNSYAEVLSGCIAEAKAIAFGSGAAKMSRKSEVLDLILQNSKVPVVLDAEALRLLHQNTWVLRFCKCPVILTPHIGEFADLINKPVEYVMNQKITCAKEFAKRHKVYLVLKGPNTIVASPNGDCYINQSGNQALAQAGSGDLLTGMMAGILTMTKDIFSAVCMSVWLHGHLSDYGLKYHARLTFPLEDYPRIMDEILKEHGY